MIVIYDRNDSGLYHKSTIITNLALARSNHRIIIYDRKERYKQKHNSRLYLTFTVQATAHNYLQP